MKKRIFFTTAAVFWMLLIFYFSSQPAVESAALSGGVTEWLKTKLDGIPVFQSFLESPTAGILEHIIRKMAHAGEYAVLGILVLLALRTYLTNEFKTVVISGLWCAGYAATDEFHQLFVPGRGGQISDVLLDTAGAACGILLCILIIKGINRYKKYSFYKRSLK